jgi:hypothetical protein
MLYEFAKLGLPIVKNERIRFAGNFIYEIKRRSSNIYSSYKNIV